MHSSCTHIKILCSSQISMWTCTTTLVRWEERWIVWEKPFVGCIRGSFNSFSSLSGEKGTGGKENAPTGYVRTLHVPLLNRKSDFLTSAEFSQIKHFHRFYRFLDVFFPFWCPYRILEMERLRKWCLVRLQHCLFCSHFKALV